MLILGLILLAAGALLVVLAVFTAEVADGRLEILGTEIGALTLFLLGLGAGAAILWGLTITRLGTRRELRQRRERQDLDELSEKLDHASAERRRDLDDDDPDRSPLH